MFTGAGSTWCEGYQVRSNATFSPSAMVNSASVFMFSLRADVPLHSENMKTEAEFNFFAFRNGELRFGLHVFTVKRHIRPQSDHVRTGNGGNPVPNPPNPGHHRPVIEPNHQFQLHPDLASGADDYAQNRGHLLARHHAVDNLCRSAFSLKLSLQNQSPIPILPANASDRPLR